MNFDFGEHVKEFFFKVLGIIEGDNFFQTLFLTLQNWGILKTLGNLVAIIIICFVVYYIGKRLLGMLF